MSVNSATKMEVDNPSILKRSSSAPMINDLNPAMTTSSTTVTKQREPTSSFNFFSTHGRARRSSYSASFSPMQNSGGLSPRLTPRVNQILQEECENAIGREMAHEREVHSAMAMSASCEDLRLVGSKDDKLNENSESNDSTNGSVGGGGGVGGGSKMARTGLLDPLHISTAIHTSPSPSPTRMLTMRPNNFSPTAWRTNLSPSPTRKSFCTRRSSSPIAMRPSSLGPVKRKVDVDDNEPPAKRSSGLLLAQSRLDVTASPLTGSLSSVGTPESLSSAGSPGSFIDNSTTLADHPMQDLGKAAPASPT
ncbi:protein FAM122A isoform X2 [Nilaparvata lugens]|uniref:protein FAM122A isoform X2 n=1 Tax=Nilaparvata lugens TaxID=108931 RepID=UPI00193E2648|nr:protein FAM122A isoform X2 [Nilaparvata lugens]